MISIRKGGNIYQYCFAAGKVNGKRKQITKSGFKTKNEVYITGQKAYDEFLDGVKVNECEIKNIAEVLGHKKIEITEKYHILSKSEDKKQVTKLFESSRNFNKFNI